MSSNLSLFQRYFHVACRCWLLSRNKMMFTTDDKVILCFSGSWCKIWTSCCQINGKWGSEFLDSLHSIITCRNHLLFTCYLEPHLRTFILLPLSIWNCRGFVNAGDISNVLKWTFWCQMPWSKRYNTFQSSRQILPHNRKTFNQQISSKVSAWMINGIESNQLWRELCESCIHTTSVTWLR